MANMYKLWSWKISIIDAKKVYTSADVVSVLELFSGYEMKEVCFHFETIKWHSKCHFPIFLCVLLLVLISLFFEYTQKV